MTNDTWIWGRRPVLESLRAADVKQILLSRTVRDAQIIASIRAAAEAANVPLEVVDEREIGRLVSGEASQGVVARLAELKLHSVDEVLRAPSERDEVPLMLILDRVQDPRNVGSLLRSAEALGVHGVIMTAHDSAPLTGTVAKTSAGAVYNIPIARVPSLSQALEKISKSNMWSIGLDESGTQSLWDCDLSAPTAIVIGGEGRGMRRLTSERVDLIVSIPLRGRVESLNASVAGGIALAEASRQRTKSGTDSAR